jgi:hypothetical protein
MRRGPTVVAGLAALAGAACHVVAQSELTRPLTRERIVHPEGAVARRPALVWTDAGALRFVEPLECPTEDRIRQRAALELVTRPNLATFTVGVIAATLGGVMLTSGLFSSHPGSSPYSYAGGAGLALGLPFAIGPWIGNRTELRDAASPITEDRRPGPSQPCGERPLAARAATLEVSGLEIRGAIDRDGVFAISPYAWIDAYAPATAPAAVTARVEADAGARTIDAVLDTGALAGHAAAFLARAGIDARIEPLTLVPGVVGGPLRVSLTTTASGPALRVALPLRNDGPGAAWGLRGQITAPGSPAIDGRMIYAGALARGASVTRELVIPIAPAVASALGAATLELSVELRDAHGTAPSTPIRFRGRVPGEPPR